MRDRVLDTADSNPLPCTDKQSVDEFQQTQGGEPVKAWQVDFAPLRIKLRGQQEEEKLKLDPNAYLDDDDDDDDEDDDDGSSDNGYAYARSCVVWCLVGSFPSSHPTPTHPSHHHNSPGRPEVWVVDAHLDGSNASIPAIVDLGCQVG